MLILAHPHRLSIGLLGVAAFAGQVFAQSRGSLTPNYPTHLRGTVINAITHDPVPRALVHSPDNRFATITNDEGRFDFTLPQVQISPAPTPVGSTISQLHVQAMTVNRPYALMARKPGYLEYNDGQEQVAIEATQEEVTVPLFPEARVIGRVTPSGTDSAERIQVALYRRLNQGGRERWEPISGNVMTRSGGEFRFANLPPGSYKLLTQESMDRDPLAFFPGGGQIFGFPPVYYPTASDFESAAIIHLSSGQTLQTTLTPARRAYYPLRLPITNNPGSDQFQIDVWPQNHPGPGFTLGYSARQDVVTGSLPDGAYTVVLRLFSPIAMTGIANVVVSGAPVTGPSVSLVPNVSVPVTVREEMQHRPEVSMSSRTPSGEIFTASPRRASYASAMLVPLEPFGFAQDVGLSPPTGPDDILLRFDNVPPGRYRVRVTLNGGYVASVVSGSTDVRHNPLVVEGGSAPQPIEITVRDDGAEVQGHVDGLLRDAAQVSMQTQLLASAYTVRGAFRNAWGSRQPVVYFIPEPRGSSGQFTRIFVAPGGEFQSSQIAPGSYRVLAFDRPQDELEFASEDELRRYDSATHRIELAAGDKQTLKLSIMSTEE